MAKVDLVGVSTPGSQPSPKNRATFLGAGRRRLMATVSRLTAVGGKWASDFSEEYGQAIS
eukprot:11164838-Lingulodinium_polyedra.AAC.1